MELPADLARQFDGEDLAAKTDLSAILATAGADGHPHLCFLSAGEILIAGDAVLLTVHQGSGTIAALEQTGRGALFASAAAAIWELRLGARRMERGESAGTAVWVAAIVSLRTHRAPYADVHSLIGFTLREPEPVLERWRRQLLHMRALHGGHLPKAPAEGPSGRAGLS